MLPASLGQKLLVTGGLLVSLPCFSWLISLRPAEFGIAGNIGWVCAALSVGGLLVFLWGSSFAYIGQKCDWSPRWCKVISVSSLVLCLAPILLVTHRVFSAGGMVLSLGVFSGMASVKLGYADNYNREFYGSEWSHLHLDGEIPEHPVRKIQR